MNELNSNDSAMDIIAQYIAEMKTAQGADFSYEKVNLAELERRTGLSRQRLRTLQKHEFKEAPHGNTGKTPIRFGADREPVTIRKYYKKRYLDLKQHNKTVEKNEAPAAFEMFACLNRHGLIEKIT